MTFEVPEEKPDVRRVGKETIGKIINNVKGQLSLHPIRVFILSLIAGGLLCYGAAMGVRLSVGLNSAGAEHFMVTFGFLAGFSVVALSGAILNSASNVEYSIFLLNSLTTGYNKAHIARVALFWCIVNVGNILGAMGTSALFVYVQIFNEADEQRLSIILQDKLKNADDGVVGIFVVFVSAMLANWIVGHCVINATSARHVTGRVAGIFYCVFMFSVLGLQHGAATNGQIFLGLISNVSPIGWGRSFYANILPVVVGNAVGALVFVGWPFWYSLHFAALPKNTWKFCRETNLPSVLTEHRASLSSPIITSI